MCDWNNKSELCSQHWADDGTYSLLGEDTPDAGADVPARQN